MNKNIISICQKTKDFQNRKNVLYNLISTEWNKHIQKTKLKSSKANEAEISLNPIGKIIFPFTTMGNVNSLDLFGLDEIILFSFYWFNRKKYKKVADIGGNIGLHSIILEKCGYQVETYEPDPNHIKILKKNLKLNKSKNVKVFQCAVSNEDKMDKFIRVLGNTTGSHLSGAKKNPYGELKYFDVKVKSIKKIIKNVDLIKMDVEGEEAKIISSLSRKDLENTDIIGEISDESNKKIIFDFCKYNNINIFTQKKNWNIAKKINDLPSSHKEGSVFMSSKNSFDW